MKHFPSSFLCELLLLRGLRIYESRENGVKTFSAEKVRKQRRERNI